VHRIIAADTVDEVIIEAVTKKATVQELLIKSLK